VAHADSTARTVGRFSVLHAVGELSKLRLGPTIVRRQALDDWLARFKNVPVRFLIAPPGFGKTVAILDYLRHSATNGFYCSLPPASSPATIWNAIARALEVKQEFQSHEELCRALAARAPLELALDCEDVPDADAIAVMLRLIGDLPEQVSLIIACRSREAFQVGRLVSEGAAVLCDAERLAFTSAEIRQVAESCGVPFAHASVPRMLHATDGWPRVVSAALRKAAEDGCSFDQAIKNYRLHRGHLFNEFVIGALARASERDANLVRKLMGGSHLCDSLQLQALEAQGLFVIHTGDGFRALRSLSSNGVHDLNGGPSQRASPMEVQVLGWFLAGIDRQSIKWIRRRDRQIFEYIALQPNGRASRDEIAQVFWPAGEKRLVAQSLRTACTNIRKAIANIVGFDQVGAYFRVGADLSLDLNNVVVDLNSYVAHANDGDEQYARGELQSADAQYRVAASIYHGDLLIADSHEPWVVTFHAALQQRHITVLKRIAENAPTTITRLPTRLLRHAESPLKLGVKRLSGGVRV
jgi:Bacterial transcriptional activator domain